MECDLLAELSQSGFFPGPKETQASFLLRVEKEKKRYEALFSERIPASDWEWAKAHLMEIFDFRPECVAAIYSNHSLMPWQAAAVWIEQTGATKVQLRTSLRKGSMFWGLYEREEILAHEAVHAARAAFSEDRWEEFFAFMTSRSKWRRVIGPILQKPWEVWPFLISCFIGLVSPFGYLVAAIWAFAGFVRLAASHKILKQAAGHLSNRVKDPRKVRAVLVRLSGAEILALSRGQVIGDDSFRWNMIRKTYFSEEQ